MSKNVQFDEAPIVSSHRRGKKSSTSSIPRRLVDWGVAKNEGSAKGLMFIGAVVLLLLSLFILFFMTPSTPKANQNIHVDEANL